MRRRILLLLAGIVALGAAPAGASAAVVHLVAPGESLFSIAAADGLSEAQLAAANGLPADAQLLVGTSIAIPPQGALAGAGATYQPALSSGAGAATTAGPSAAATDADGDGDNDTGGSEAATASTPAGGGSYVVVPGDTLSAIAARAGVSVAQLAAANGLDPTHVLLSGTVLHLSGASGAVAAPSSGTASAATQPVGAAAQGSASGPPYPTAETVSPQEVGSIAASAGVPPSLAEAIAYQESGFNNGLVSSADARGVMQILPGTWNWIGQTLSGQMPLAPASAQSNIRAGVLLLHSLLNSTGGNSALAAAGYYQGLSSVQRNGLYPDTQQYVNDVMALQHQFGGG
jgi:LysM repeat protein